MLADLWHNKEIAYIYLAIEVTFDQYELNGRFKKKYLMSLKTGELKYQCTFRNDLNPLWEPVLVTQ